MGRVVSLRSEAPTATKAPPKLKLTKRTVESIKEPAGGEVWRWDSEVKGFGIRVRSTGLRIYVAQYRDIGGRTRRMHLGRHGVLTAEEARNLAKQTLGAVARGENPSADRREGRAEARKTVSELAARFLEHVERLRKPSTVRSYRRLIGTHILPRLGPIAVTGLSHEEVRSWHARLEDTPIEANRALAVLSSMYGYARVANPCGGVERYPENERRRFYSVGELATLGKVLAERERTRTMLPGSLTAIRLLALTGCRLGEVVALRWADVDLEAGVLRLPDAKAGARLVPLSGAARALLDSLPRSGEYPVTGVKPGMPLSKWTLEDAWDRIRTGAKLEDARLHDLRHTVGTFAGAAGLNAFAVRDLLGHKTLAMTSRYVSQDTNPLRRAADAAIEPIARALSGAKAGGSKRPRQSSRTRKQTRKTTTQSRNKARSKARPRE